MTVEIKLILARRPASDRPDASPEDEAGWRDKRGHTHRPGYYQFDLGSFPDSRSGLSDGAINPPNAAAV